MNLNDLLPPDLAAVKQLQDKAARRPIEAVRAAILDTITQAHPATIAMLADHIHLTALQEHSRECFALEAGDSAAIAPLLSAVFRRYIELDGEITGLNSRINVYSTGKAERHRAVLLAAAGLDQDEIERIIGPDPVHDLKGQLAILKAEHDSLGAFLATRDRQHLPPDFQAPAIPPKVTIPIEPIPTQFRRGAMHGEGSL